LVAASGSTNILPKIFAATAGKLGKPGWFSAFHKLRSDAASDSFLTIRLFSNP
jgi:hypothetical protein